MLYLVLHVNKVAIGLHQPIARLALLGIQLNKIKLFFYTCYNLMFITLLTIPFMFMFVNLYPFDLAIW